MLKSTTLAHLTLLSLPSTLLADPLPLTHPLFPRATPTTCAADNCLRALSNAYTSTSGASSFCTTYTQSHTTPIPIPSYASSGCANNPSRVSSACTCLATSYGQPKPFHRVYGGATGTNGTAYTIYDEALNIRSDDYPSGTYDQFLQRCRDLCAYNGNGCQTLSFVMENDYRFYLCYIYAGLFNASKLSVEPGNLRNVVEERYQS